MEQALVQKKKTETTTFFLKKPTSQLRTTKHMKTIAVKLTDEVYAAVRETARDEWMDMSKYLRRAINAALAKSRANQKKRKYRAAKPAQLNVNGGAEQ